MVPEWVTETHKITTTECTPETRQHKFTVTRCIPEMPSVQREYTVMVPETRTCTETFQVAVPTTRTVTEQYQVCVPTYRDVKRNYSVCVPEWRQQQQQCTVMVPYTETRQATLAGVRVRSGRGNADRLPRPWPLGAAGGVQANLRRVRPELLRRCSSGGCGSCGECCSNVWVPNPVQEQVQVTVMRPQVREVHYQDRVTLCRPETRTRMVNVCSYRTEMRTCTERSCISSEMRSRTCCVPDCHYETRTREVCYMVCVPQRRTVHRAGGPLSAGLRGADRELHGHGSAPGGARRLRPGLPHGAEASPSAHLLRLRVLRRLPRLPRLPVIAARGASQAIAANVS